ncbi:uncharacterized protein [Fopius arisanus]|uniref:Uncharacterized protein isoform X2 n=1 Tax=Fopius arisanus TaxID=64838 RepID=A0A9R1UBT4_9HYME|nr:PREDICTED: uncharacterized protein LOC105273871 isoform X2 [Fopius arisanus]
MFSSRVNTDVGSTAAFIGRQNEKREKKASQSATNVISPLWKTHETTVTSKIAERASTSHCVIPRIAKASGISRSGPFIHTIGSCGNHGE